MSFEKKLLYRFPWSKTDNPGAWIEVTDQCDLECEGCYRHQLEGHRAFDKIKEDITACKELTNCDCITISGGEPLIYPQIIEVVDFIKRNKIKPIIFSNGMKLTRQLAAELKKAGLAKFHFHIDSGQNRPEWENRSETELNDLRQEYADLLWDLGGVQCGFHTTVYRKNLMDIPRIVGWCMNNTHKVQHMSFIAYRAIPIDKNLKIIVNNQTIDPTSLKNSTSNRDEINITTEEMYEKIHEQFPDLLPSAYLNGSTKYDTFKFLIISNIGSKKMSYGVLGAKTVELAQVFYHIFYGRYFAFLKRPVIGKKIFLLSFLDKRIRAAFKHFLIASIRNPSEILNRVYVQSIHLQQPNEIIDGMINLCDDCVNMMVYRGRLINSCRLDEYRIYGEPFNIIKI
jgi:hypothetical protein